MSGVNRMSVADVAPAALCSAALGDDRARDVGVTDVEDVQRMLDRFGPTPLGYFRDPVPHESRGRKTAAGL